MVAAAAWIAAALVRRNVPAAWARPIAWALLAIAAALLAWLAVALALRAITGAHDARQAADQRQEQIERIGEADGDQLRRDQQAEAAQANLQGAIENAIEANPEAAGRAGGPASNAALRELRERQQRAAERR
ncbi:hypothetical protein ACFQ1E_08070 [Sphingomonas canadensis]|uniref:Uncharacterized protein n=1 Tax=Sphingomonas canadensis TaxID=1219257 RepID=A0ABW3H4B6_9SPHN|nr:hypothetical protein [Sphingomonas canadensis]MCW3835992.1 hypothetical protein [Sphingomonas canadensis]